MVAWLAFGLLAALALGGGWLVFRVGSMVRATLSLLLSFLAVAAMLLLLQSAFLFAITFLMMIGEMMIMAMFMVAFMMNPAGLNPMSMVHQPRFAAAAGLTAFAAISAAVLATDFPERKGEPPADVTAALGHELMGGSMLIFETAGVALLTGMVAVMVLAARRGRFGGAIVAQRDAANGEGGGHAHH